MAALSRLPQRQAQAMNTSEAKRVLETALVVLERKVPDPEPDAQVVADHTGIFDGPSLKRWKCSRCAAR